MKRFSGSLSLRLFAFLILFIAAASSAHAGPSLVVVDNGGDFSTSGGGSSPTPSSTPPSILEANVGMKNPAAVYCEILGYTYKTIRDPQGDYGICLMPDGTTCEAFAFLQGLCGQAFNACAKEGYDTQVTNDGNNGITQQYAVCTSGQHVISSATSLTNLTTTATSASAAVDESQLAASIEAASLSDANALALNTTTSLPASIDWRNMGGKTYLGPVRDQGICGSCVAFGVAGAIEGTYNARIGGGPTNLDLSEQFLVANGNNTPSGSGVTCCGGSAPNVLSNIFTWAGIPDERCLVYNDGDAYNGCSCSGTTCSGTCTYRTGGYCSDSAPANSCTNAGSRKVGISGWGQVIAYYYPDNARSLLSQGIMLEAYMGIGDQYGGYFDANNIYRCRDKSNVNHAVTVVGYNSNGWIIRNSWTPYWGDGGYAVVGYGECQIESAMLYPVPIQSNSVKKCGDAISQTTDLMNDLTNCTSGLTITASNVTLNCNGHSISGNANGTGIGITIASGVKSATLQNCSISNFGSGIYLSPAADWITIKDNIIFSNVNGIDLASNSGTQTILQNHIYSNFIDGMKLSTSKGSLIAKNTVCGNRVDLDCVGAVPSTTGNYASTANNCPTGWSTITCSDKPVLPSKWPWLHLALKDVGNDYIAVTATANQNGAPSSYELRISTEDPMIDYGGNYSAWWQGAMPLSLQGQNAAGAVFTGAISGLQSNTPHHLVLRQFETQIETYNYDESISVFTTQNLVKNPEFELDSGMTFFPQTPGADKTAANLLPDGFVVSRASAVFLDTKLRHSQSYGLKITNIEAPDRNFAYQDVPVIYGHKYRISGWVANLTTDSNDFGTILSDCRDGLHNKIANCGLNINSQFVPKVYKTLGTDAPWVKISYDLVATSSAARYLRITCANSPLLNGNPGGVGSVWCDSLSVLDISGLQCPLSGTRLCESAD